MMRLVTASLLLQRAAMAMAVATALLGLPACQLFGLMPVPCEDDSHCTAPLVCQKSDAPSSTGKVCGRASSTPVIPPFDDVLDPVDPTLDDRCTGDGPRVAGENETVSIVATATAGALALSNRFGAETASVRLVGDDCLIGDACGFASEVLTSWRAPVGQRVEHAFGKQSDANATLSTSFVPQSAGAFAFELIARVPSEPGTIAEQVGAWRVAYDTDLLGRPALLVGIGQAPAALVLADAPARRYFHLLCVIDAPFSVTASASDVATCSLDGGTPLLPPGIVRVGLIDPSPTVELLTGNHDGAIAVFQAWAGARIDGDSVARQDRINLLGAQHLASYVGLQARGKQLAYLGAQAAAPKLLLADGDGDELPAWLTVGPLWPRVSSQTASPSTDDPAPLPLPALLLEPARSDLAAGALRECDTFADAGTWPHPAVPVCRSIDRFTTALSAESAHTLSVIVNDRTLAADGTSLTLSIDDASCAFDLAHGASDCSTGSFGALTDVAFGIAVAQLSVATGIADAPLTHTVSIAFDSDTASIFGAQLEPGMTRSSPLLPDTATGVPARDADVLLWNLVPPGPINRLDVDMTAIVPTVGSAQDTLLHIGRAGTDDNVAFGYGSQASDAAQSIVARAESSLFATQTSVPLSVAHGEDSEVRLMFLGHSSTALGCPASVRCTTISLPQTATDGTLEGTHVMLGNAAHPVWLRSMLTSLRTGATPPVSTSLRVEPRLPGCADRRSPLFELVRYERCPAGVDPTRCGDVPTWDVGEDTATLRSPFPQRQARNGGADIALAPASASLDGAGALVELRFLVPTDDRDIAHVVGDSGDILHVETAAGALYVAGPDATLPAVVVPSAYAPSGGFVQLLCAIPGANSDVVDPRVVELAERNSDTQCLLNLAEAPLVVGGKLSQSAIVGVTLASGVTFDRARIRLVDDEQLTLDRAQREQASSFGFFAAETRATLHVHEMRDVPAYQENDGELFLVGAGFPRSTSTTGRIAYRSDAPLVDSLADDFSAFTVLRGRVGQRRFFVPGAFALDVQDATLRGPSLDVPGCFSVYAKPNGSARVRLLAGDVEDFVTLDSSRARLRNGFMRLSVCVAGVQRLSTLLLEVDGSAQLAIPQVDADTVTSPAAFDVRSGELLRITSSDLAQLPMNAAFTITGVVRGTGDVFHLASSSSRFPRAPAFHLGQSRDNNGQLRLLLTNETDDDDVLQTQSLGVGFGTQVTLLVRGAARIVINSDGVVDTSSGRTLPLPSAAAFVGMLPRTNVRPTSFLLTSMDIDPGLAR